MSMLQLQEESRLLLLDKLVCDAFIADIPQSLASELRELSVTHPPSSGSIDLSLI